MIRKNDIKRELIEEEFKKLIAHCEKEFEEATDIDKIVLGCEEKTKDITPSKEAYLLYPIEESYEFEIATLNRKIPMNRDKEGVISECYHTKQPLIVNDTDQSFLYQNRYDNLLGHDIKDILVVPILDDTPQKRVLSILWAAIPRGSWNQYTQRDIDYMARFTIFIKRFLHQKKFSPKEAERDIGSSDCMEAYDNLSAKIRREQEYFSGIIHEIRTPMNGVLGFLELLQVNEVDPKKKEYIETALKSGETMVALINDALDISKMSSGKMSVEKVEFSILEELSDAAKLFYNSARKKDIDLIAFYDPRLPKIICSDYHRIKQIMNNLLNNAIKFTPQKGTIEIDLLYDKQRDGLTISIKDSGIGIAKDMQENIFSPYTQEKNSTSREYGGTGLGLSISQQLSVLLGGKMELESQEGRGSRFYFTIPCNTPKDTPPSIDREKIKALSVMIYSPAGKHNTIDITKRYLRNFNLIIEETKSDESIDSLANRDFDILVILKEDTISHEEYIQEILDTDKSVIVIEDGCIEEEHSWHVGNISTINAPILPHNLYNTILEFITPKTTQEIESSNPEELKDKSILVVDDSTVNLKFMQEVFKILNIKTVMAKSGEESVEKCKNEKFDMIIMDKNMPGVQGEETIDMIRKMEKKRGEDATVIIGLTGDTQKRTKDEFLSSGADDVMTKPIQFNEIKAIVGRYL
ncbi:MAG: ATP-binding protein [Campylobacterota bacterium]|nr:ATP-binding protein [Campylobacterota bacterium]